MIEDTSHAIAAKANDRESGECSALGRAGAAMRTIAMRTIPQPKIIGAVFAVAALLLGFTAPTHAQQIVDLVSNTAVSTLTDGTYQLTHEDSAAQAFTTGSNRTGYDLDSIVVDLATFPASGAFDFAVKLWSGAANGEPGSVLCTLSSGGGLGTGLVRFFVTSLSSCPTPLTANTQYFVVMSFELTSNQIITDLPEWVFTLSGSEDSGAAAGWSISDSYYHRNTNSGPWVEGSASLNIKVKGAYTNQDRAALVALYDATDGDNWRNKTKWKSTDPLGNWRGVTTNAAGRVTGLDLRVNDLSGPIPSDLGDLTYLDTMNLAENTLSGLIPADLGDLTYLQTLNLGYNNGLTGSIPAALGNLGNLKYLLLYSNSLSGPIPAALGGLTNLEILNLSTNKLTGSIPTALGGLTNLKDLSLFDNSLTGSIPVALGGLTNLEILNLTGTGLSGSLPVALGGLTNLTDLSLGANSLTGSIPTALGNLGNLKYLLLYSNSLTGSIPAALGGLTNLKNLELNANSLTGSIPAALGGLTNLTYLALDANSLTGSIPTELGNLTNLEGLSLNANSLTGSIPTELGDLSNLLELYVDNGLCVPAHTAFQQWLEDLENFGGDSTNICPNNAPTAAGKTVSTNEDMAYTFAAADFGFSDLDSGLDSGATLDHVKITALPGTNRGTLSLDGADISSTPATVAADQLDDSPDDNLKYTPPADANGNAFATFAFKVNDGDLDSAASYIITVDVSAVNDAAVATTDTAETSVGTAIIIGVLENDSDVDGDTLRVVEVGVPTAPSNGTAAINTNATTVTYTPDATFTAGADTFDYTVTDGLVEVTTSVTVTIIPARQNANLSNLTISSGTLTGDFAATTMSYAVEVGATTASVSVTPTTAEVGAAVTVNGRAVTSGSASDQIALALGVATAIPVNVTATDGTTIQTYTITVHRAADHTRPTVAITSEAAAPLTEAFTVTITFSEPVTGFELEDIRVTNGRASNFLEISPQEYTATITPDGSGEVRVEVPEEVAEDGSGNGNQAAAFEVETKLAVSYQEESYTAREGGETVTVTVKLSQGWDEELVIPIRVTRPETTEVADYTLDGLQEWDAQEGTGTLTFPAEETEQILRIAANHDGDGDDEMVELGFGELPEIVMAGDPAVATVTLEDKGLVELKVSFGQTEYQIREGQQADIEVTVSPAADRRVEVPLVVAPKGGATDEDYSGVPSKVVFEEGESEGTISVAVLADEVIDPGEGIVLSLGELPEAVRAGEIPETTVNFTQQRTAEQFSQTLEVMLAVMARTMGESAQTAIEGRFERHRQWSRLGAVGGAVPTAQPGSDNSATSLGEGESQRRGSESLEGAGRRRAEGPVVPSAGGAAGARAAMGSSGESGDRESGVQGAWLQNVSLGGLAGLFGYGQGYAGVSTGAGRGPSGTGPTVGLGGQPGYGQNRFQGSGTRNSSLRSGSGEYSGRRKQELNLAGVSLELPLAGQPKGTSRSWVPALWGQGDLTRFNGNLTRLGMSYRGGLEAAHVGLDLYANDKVLAGLSFMRSWGNMDYSDDGIDGVLGSRMNTFHPYLYWQPTERVSVWGMGGVGRGQVDVNEPGRRHDFEADFRMFSGGARSVLSRRGHYEFGLRADAFTAQLGTAASEDIAKVTGHAHRARLMLEWVHDEVVVFATPGRTMYLKAEVGGRFDGGDADRGSGAETGFRLGYLDANSGLDVVMLGRVLVVHESDYRDWGLGVQASWDPGEKQRGVRVSVTSTRGQDGGGRTTLWNNANTVTRPPGMGAMGMSSQSLMESEVAYAGLTAPGVPGLLTPYSRLRWAGQGRELAWGTAWSLPPRAPLALPLMLELEAVRRETRTGPADLAVLVRMSTPF